MALFVNIDERAAAVIVAAAGLVLWAVLAPESFNSTVEMVWGGITGAVSGAQAGVSG